MWSTLPLNCSHAVQAAAARKFRAALTMLVSAGMTSCHCRVFRPQSGLLQAPKDVHDPIILLHEARIDRLLTCNDGKQISEVLTLEHFLIKLCCILHV